MVFYFSGSGNSYYVANMLSVGLDTPLISMADALKKREMNFDARADGTCGFVFPVHFWGVPYLVTEFINNMQLKTNDDTYVEVKSVAGNCMPVIVKVEYGESKTDIDISGIDAGVAIVSLKYGDKYVDNTKIVKK